MPFIRTRPFDKNMWFYFIYSFFCVRPFDQNLGPSLNFFFFFLFANDHSTKIYDPPSFILALHTPVGPKLKYSLIYLFYLYMTIQPNIRVLTDFLLLFAHGYSTKSYGPLSFILFLYDHLT